MQKCGAAGAYGYKGSLGMDNFVSTHIERGLYDMSLEKGKAEALQRVIDELRDEPAATGI